MTFSETFYFLEKFIFVLFSLDDLNSLTNWEQMKGAKNPVRKTSARIFWTLGIKTKKLLFEKLLNKICKKYKVPHKKLPKAQIKPYLKCPTNKSLWIFILPNQTPHKTKPGIWEKYYPELQHLKLDLKTNQILFH